MANPNTNEIGKIQQLIIKNPFAFVGSVFFLMFWITYFINLKNSNSSEDYYKRLYEEERKKNDDLNTKLLIKAGVIEKQKAESKEADSTLREQTLEQAKQILNYAK